MTPQQEAAKEGIDLDAATERVQGILRGDSETIIHLPPAPKGVVGRELHFTLPDVPAAVQEAGDKAFAQSAKRNMEGCAKCGCLQEAHYGLGVGCEGVGGNCPCNGIYQFPDPPRRKGTSPIVVEKGDTLAQAMERKRAPRSDKGKKRALPGPPPYTVSKFIPQEPQPAPVPEQKAGGITREQADHIRFAAAAIQSVQKEFNDVDARLNRAVRDFNDLLDSLAKDGSK